jgi:signal transduction histidine kinase
LDLIGNWVRGRMMANLEHNTTGLEEDMIEIDLREYIDIICNSGDNLLAIINNILDFSKIESGELEFEQIPVVLNGSFCIASYRLLRE